MKMIYKVNQHWQVENSPEVRSFWDNAVYHTGNMEAYFLTGNETYRAYSETRRWKYRECAGHAGQFEGLLESFFPSNGRK